MYPTFHTGLCSALLILSHLNHAVSQQHAILDQQTQQAPIQSEHSQFEPPYRVAIVGAGAGGASAAYHLRKYINASQYDTPFEINIFDTNDRAGGRTTTVNALDDPRFPVEVGASIFVKINHILYNASRDFGFGTDGTKWASTGSLYELGVWDGRDFVFTSKNDPDDDNKGISGRLSGWWDIAKLIWKYGLAPIRTNSLMKSTVGKFLKFYDEQFPFVDLDEAAEAVGLDEFTGVTGSDALSRGGVSEEFARHVVQASTRVNYAQNLGSIHGLEAMVCMATDGAMAVEGGNWQIFDEFVKRSQAKAHFRTSVKTVEKTDRGTYRITSQHEGDETRTEDEEFNTIILAAPYQFANVTFLPPLTKVPAKVDYVKLHVTLFTSSYLPSPQYFGLDGQYEVPDTILTTLQSSSKIPDTARGKYAVGPTKFWSISTRAIETDDPTLGKQYLYKIFSPEPISVTFLGKMFNFALPNNKRDNNNNDNHSKEERGTDEDGFQPLSTAPRELISWYHVKTWNSYPYLPPTTSFPPLRLDSGVYYTSAIEPFISTMETSALAGMNIAKMIVQGQEWEVENTHYLA